eukprot:m.204823 g.204823  ORF g.204823 m.204823 type:complete len:166 (+) comp32902_c0_seq4:199-696(+)
MTQYLHDVGDILWFEDTIVLTPALFFSQVLGSIFHPSGADFGLPANTHSFGELVEKETLVSICSRALGIGNEHTDSIIALLCDLGLCHRRRHPQNPSKPDSFLFPGAISNERNEEWFKELEPGRHYVAGRRFELADPKTSIWTHGTLPQIQVWALGRVSEQYCLA